MTDVSHDPTLPEPAGGAAASATPGYVLGELLGRGGMGDVVLAHDVAMGRDVALKRMRSDTPSTEAIDRFLREAKVQAKLDHPSIVPVHALGRDADELPYFTMKRITGRTLTSHIEGGTSLQTLLRAFVDVCLAIDLAHARRIVHRDLKPSNIMLGDYGEVYVLDWGVARVLADREIPSLDGEVIPASDSSTSTKAGQLLGTPGYMAPEQVRGDEVGPPADIYALGAILFELLTREPLHQRGMAALASTLAEFEPSPGKRRAGIAPELDALCVRCLSEDAAKRPTARELANEAQAFLDGDRDLEQRKRAAVVELARARSALEAGDRAEAVHAAGRALVLDAASSAATDFLMTLLARPPVQLPAELAASLAELEEQAMRQRSKRAILPHLLLIVAVAPFLPWLTVRSWPLLMALFAVAAGLAFLSWINWKVRLVPVGLLLGAQVVFVVLFSRLTTPFILTPVLIAGILLAMTAIPWVNDRRWVVFGFAIVTSLLPLGLEELGVFMTSWHVTPDGMLMDSTIFKLRSKLDVALFVAGNTAMAMTLGMYSLAIARDRRYAQRAMHVQTWHLRQLLPRAAR